MKQTPGEFYIEKLMAWSTHYEKDFIDNIGTYGEIKRDKAQLLRGYIKGMNKRTELGLIDKQECLSYANKKLYEVTGTIG